MSFDPDSEPSTSVASPVHANEVGFWPAWSDEPAEIIEQLPILLTVWLEIHDNYLKPAAASPKFIEGDRHLRADTYGMVLPFKK